MATNLIDVEPKFFNYPGKNARSKVWELFGFVNVKDGPPAKDNLDMNKAICRICRKAPCIDDFIFVKPISRGAFGKVLLGQKKSCLEHLYAIKVMKKADMVNKNLVSQVITERDALASSSCPFVVQLYYSLQTHNNIFLVMEYLIGGDIKSLLAMYGYFDEEMAVFYTAEVALALEYLHSRGIIHRDIKPDNMLISSTGHMKLTDFGLSMINPEKGIVLSEVSHVQKQFRTPGQILSLSSALAFSVVKRKTPSSVRITSDRHALFKSPVCDVNRRGGCSLRNRLLSQATVAKLTPPMQSLTPKMQESMNWKSSGSTSLQSQSECTSSLAMNTKHSTTSASSLYTAPEANNMSYSMTDDVFKPASTCIHKPVDSTDFIHGTDTGMEIVTNTESSVKAAIPSYVGKDNTPHVYRSNEAVWNSYAARNLRNMREGSYSEESDHIEASPSPACPSKSFMDSPAFINSKMLRCSSRVSEDKARDNSSYCYLSDDDSSDSSAFARRISKISGRKRTFSNIQRSPLLNSSSTGITGEFNRLHAFGDEPRFKRFNQQIGSSSTDSDGDIKQNWSMANQLQATNPRFSLNIINRNHTDHEKISYDLSEKMCVDNVSMYDNVTSDSTECCRHGPEYSSNSGSSVPQTDCLVHFTNSSGDVAMSRTGDDASLFCASTTDDSHSSESQESTSLFTMGDKARIRHSTESDQKLNSVPSLNDESLPLVFQIPAIKQTKVTCIRSNDSYLPHSPHRSLLKNCGMAATNTTPDISQPFKKPRGWTVQTPIGLRNKTPYRTPKSVRRGAEPIDDEQRILGTPDYLAPELLLQKGHDSAVDWWSLGVCLFEFLTGVPPFNDQTPELVFQNILNKDIPWPDGDESLSEAAQQTIVSLLMLDPEQRATITQLKAMSLFGCLDWEHLLDTEPSFIPQPDDETDTTYFDARNTLQHLTVSAVDL